MQVNSYPGATIVSQATSVNSDRILYTTGDPIDKVAAFYIAQFGQADDTGCKQLFIDPTPSTTPGHVYYRCVSDRSVLDVTQIATIKIDSVPMSIDAINFQTQIEVDRTW